jgi:hypothetical protein
MQIVHQDYALPELFRQLKAGCYKVVHMVPKGESHHVAEVRRDGDASGRAVIEQYAT